MHELGMARNVLEYVLGVAESNGARRVKAIHVLVGESSHVTPDALRFSFGLLSRGTLAEGALLEFGPKQPIAELLATEELVVESVDIEL